MNGLILAITVVSALVWMALSIAGNWMMFKKAGKPGWHSLVPFLNVYDEFSLCWKGAYGVFFLVAVTAINLIHIFSIDNTYFLQGIHHTINSGATNIFILFNGFPIYFLNT